MQFNTHILFGILFFLFTKPFFNGGNETIFLFLILLGSILPDLDEKNSKIKQWSGIIGTITSFLVKHRGIFHSLFFALIIFFSLKLFWNNYYASALLIGYISHLVSDGLTPMGIRIFYPFSKFKMKGPIRVGSIGEWILFSMVLITIFKLVLF